MCNLKGSSVHFSTILNYATMNAGLQMDHCLLVRDPDQLNK
jgi:hypothetical protein